MKFNECMYITNKIIENEFTHVQKENLEGMENLDEYNKMAEENNERYLLLMKALPENLQKVLTKFYDTCYDRTLYEIRHYFKKGVATGTSNLNFIRDITGEDKFY